MKPSFIIIVFVFAFLTGCKTKVSKSEPIFYTNVGDENANYFPYYIKVYKADSLYIVGEYRKANKILDSLFKFYEPINQESYDEFVTYLKTKIILKDFNDIKTVLRRAIGDYGHKVEYCLNDSLIKIAIQKSKYSERELHDFYEQYEKKLNLEYRYAIEKLIENDQSRRRTDAINWDKIRIIDKENAVTIKSLIDQHGYPSIKKIGRYRFNNKKCNVGTLFLHASTEAREAYILNTMLESARKGECDPRDFATVYDKYIWVKDGSKVLYGELRNSRINWDEQVINPQKIDSIRSSIGLPHIGYTDWKIKKILGK